MKSTHGDWPGIDDKVIGSLSKQCERLDNLRRLQGRISNLTDCQSKQQILKKINDLLDGGLMDEDASPLSHHPKAKDHQPAHSLDNREDDQFDPPAWEPKGYRSIKILILIVVLVMLAFSFWKAAVVSGPESPQFGPGRTSVDSEHILDKENSP